MIDDINPEPKLVRDLMTVGVPTCPAETNIKALTRIFLEQDLEAIVVLNEHGHAIGLVSQDELIQQYAHRDRWDNKEKSVITAGEIMRPDLPEIPPNIPLSAAAQIMQDRHIRAIFLTHHAGGILYPAGMLTYKHLLRHLAITHVSELDDLGFKATRRSPMEIFYEKRDRARKHRE